MKHNSQNLLEFSKHYYKNSDPKREQSHTLYKNHNVHFKEHSVMHSSE